jgi:hypothetical protein
MGDYPKGPLNRKTTNARNFLRGIMKRVTLVTKEDLSGLEDDIVTEAAILDGSVTETKLGDAAVSSQKVKFPVNSGNILPKRYSSFAALEGSVPSSDLYVVSGGFVTIGRATTNAFLGTHTLQMTASAGGGTLALCTGSSNYPQRAIGTLLGTYHILSFYYMRSALSGQSFVVQLRYSDNSTQTISGTLTPTTTRQRYISTPFTLNSTSLAYRIEFVVTVASTLRNTYISDMMLTVTGTDANVTEVGPFIPGTNWYADDVDARALRRISTGYVQTFDGVTTVFDGTKADSQGRIVTLRQTSADLSVANILHDSGSGISKDGATADLTLASGKKITVGSKDFVDTSGVMRYVSKARVLWAQSSYSATGVATEAVATTNQATHQAVSIFPVKKYEDDRTIRVTCEAKVSNGTGEIGKIQLSFTNGAGSYVIESSNVTSTTYGEFTAEIDVTTGDEFGEELVFGSVSIKCSDSKTISIRRAVVEMLSEDI